MSSVYGTQYNNSLKSNVAAGVKTTAGGALKGLGINFAIDLFRATSNWALASQIAELNSAMQNEEAAARAKINVLAGKD
ncbi:MAG: hypothetical protein DI622_04255 [Chryseobacterium sp.]|nr:MAG: hypothetical protein DI622_04255 [Chryseobacterium sp.]